MQLPWLIDSHADEKDDELALHLDGHPGTNHLCHLTSLLCRNFQFVLASRILLFLPIRQVKYQSTPCEIGRILGHRFLEFRGCFGKLRAPTRQPDGGSYLRKALCADLPEHELRVQQTRRRHTTCPIVHLAIKT